MPEYTLIQNCITALECCNFPVIESGGCANCPYSKKENCMRVYSKDVISILKALSEDEDKLNRIKKEFDRNG